MQPGTRSKARVCGHLWARCCSQMNNCVYILSFGLRAGCRDCCYAMTNGDESSQCCTARQATVVVPVQIIGCLLKRFSGWRELAPLGVTCLSVLGHGIRSSGASHAGQTKVSGRRSLPCSAKTQILRKFFSIAPSCGRTNTRPAHPKKRATKSWPFSWGLEHQDSCGGRWTGQSGAFPSDRRRTTRHHRSCQSHRWHG